MNHTSRENFGLLAYVEDKPKQKRKKSPPKKYDLTRLYDMIAERERHIGDEAAIKWLNDHNYEV